MSANTQQSNDLPREQSVKSPEQDLSPEGSAASARLCRAVLQAQAQDVSTDSVDDPIQHGGCGSGRDLKRAEEQPLKALLLDVTECNQQTQTHMQV